MVIKKENKIVEFMKRYGVVLVSGIVILAIAITFLVVGLSPSNVQLSTNEIGSDNKGNQDVEPVSTTPIEYSLPMKDANIIKDYSITELQYNQTLNRWEAHLSVDFASQNTDVMAIAKGKVASIENDYLLGTVITIDHGDGVTSIYASLDENILVHVGDSVTSGQVIACASASASSESADGAHLDFSMKVNGQEVDPNDYLSLQNK